LFATADGGAIYMIVLEMLLRGKWQDRLSEETWWGWAFGAKASIVEG